MARARAPPRRRWPRSPVRRSGARTLRSAMPSNGRSDSASAGRRATRGPRSGLRAARLARPPRCTARSAVAHRRRSASGPNEAASRSREVLRPGSARASSGDLGRARPTGRCAREARVLLDQREALRAHVGEARVEQITHVLRLGRRSALREDLGHPGHALGAHLRRARAREARAPSSSVGRRSLDGLRASPSAGRARPPARARARGQLDALGEREPRSGRTVALPPARRGGRAPRGCRS